MPELATPARQLTLSSDRLEAARVVELLPTPVLVGALTLGAGGAAYNPTWLLELVAVEVRARLTRGETFTLTPEAALWISPRSA